MTRFADLHIHTYFSDSTASPENVVEESLRAELACIAITDHDTLEGVKPAIAHAQGRPLEILSGIELSTEMEKKDIHILGYGFDCTHSRLVSRLAEFCEARVERMREMVRKLNEMGVVDIEFEEVASSANSGLLARPHLAGLLIAKGHAANTYEAFQKFLGENCPAYVPKLEQTPFEAIELIHAAGGAAVMAHPMITNRDELIPQFAEAGLDGLEVYYHNCPPNVVHYYEGIADQHGLLRTGGSDAHGDVKDNTFIGKVRVPYKFIEALKERIAQYQGR